MKRTIVFCCAALTASLALAQPAHPDSHWNPPGRNDHSSHMHHHWARGQRIPSQYRGSRYVVTDYSRYHLRRPPRGYHWVRDDDGNFLMVAITTGVIASLLLNSH